MSKITVDEYFARFSDEVQKTLGELRSFIQGILPDAEEKVGGWGIPAFVFGKHYIVQYAAFAKHIGLYPEPTGMEHFAAEFADYKIGKGSVQFPLNKPLPWDLIEKIVRFKVDEKKEFMGVPKIDFKKSEKELYTSKTTPSIIDVPEMTFIAIDGKGDPNTGAEYVVAVQVLYGLSYTIKMNNKAVLEYVVPPLEGFWSVGDDTFKGGGAVITDKSKFEWTMMIRQPDFVTVDIFEAAKATLAKKKPNLDISKARLEKITEGLCVQVMHIGSYDDEPATITAMDKFAADSGYAMDMDGKRRHHEIYISDPRKTAPKKLKTVIRHPIKKKGDMA